LPKSAALTAELITVPEPRWIGALGLIDVSAPRTLPEDKAERGALVS